MEKQIILAWAAVPAPPPECAFVFARVFLEPVIGRAIDYGTAAAMPGCPGCPRSRTRAWRPRARRRTLHSRRAGQRGHGIQVLAFSVAMGALFAVAFAVVHGRMRTTRVRGLALVMAASAFVVVYLVPFLKYPANPPSVGESDTIGRRTGLYLLMVVLSLLFAAAGCGWRGWRGPGWARGTRRCAGWVPTRRLSAWRCWCCRRFRRSPVR